MTEQEVSVRLTENDERLYACAKRLETVERRQDALDKLVTAVEVLAVRQESVEGNVKEIRNAVQSITEKPGKRWEALADRVLYLLLGAVFSLLLSFASINLRADQTIGGTALNLMAPALVLFLVRIIANQNTLQLATGDSATWFMIRKSTFGAGEKDPVEKAEDAGEETGGCEKNCSGDEWMGLMGRRHGSSEMAEGFGYIYVGAGE